MLLHALNSSKSTILTLLLRAGGTHTMELVRRTGWSLVRGALQLERPFEDADEVFRFEEDEEGLRG